MEKSGEGKFTSSVKVNYGDELLSPSAAIHQFGLATKTIFGLKKASGQKFDHSFW